MGDAAARICPCCGHAAALSGIRLVRGRNLVVSGDVVVHLAPQEADILAALIAVYPRVASVEALLEWHYLHIADAPTSNIIQCTVSKLRKVLAPLGVTISNQRGRGYRLEPPGMRLVNDMAAEVVA